MAAQVSFVNQNDKSQSFKVHLFGPEKNRVKVATVLAGFKSWMAFMDDGSVMEEDEDGLSMHTFVAGRTYTLSLMQQKLKTTQVSFVNQNDKSQSLKVHLFGPEKNRVKVATVLAGFKSWMAFMDDGSVMEEDEDGLSMHTFVAGRTYTLSLMQQKLKTTQVSFVNQNDKSQSLKVHLFGPEKNRVKVATVLAGFKSWMAFMDDGSVMDEDEDGLSMHTFVAGRTYTLSLMQQKLKTTQVSFVNQNDKSQSFKVHLFGPEKNRVKVATVLAGFKSSMAFMDDGSVMDEDEDGLSMHTFVAGRTYTLSLVQQDLKTSVDFHGSPMDGLGTRLITGECSRREGTVCELCRMLVYYGAVLIRAPPQTGKSSLLDLMQVDSVSVQTFKKIYRINLAQLSESYTFDDVWKSDIGKGVSYSDFQSTPESSPEGKGEQQANRRLNLLLVDEGQNGFGRELALWGLLKMIQGGYKKHISMLIVSAWGSHVGFQGSVDATVTPGTWVPEAVVSLWQTSWSKISLQLTIKEATEIWKSSTVSTRLTESMRDMIFDLSDRQPGLLIHVLDFLHRSGFQNSANCEEEAVRCLTSLSFYESLSSLRSIVRLNDGIQNHEHGKQRREFLRVMLQGPEVTEADLRGLGLEAAAHEAVRWGQVTEHLGESGKVLKLPSKLHEIFFMKQLYLSRSPQKDFAGLFDFVTRVVERMDPSQLVNSVSRSVADDRLYERLYQVEFYRAALTLLPLKSWLSPDAGRRLGGGGFLDFYLTPYRWGFEILRDGSRIQAHLDRFKEGGLYHELLRNGKMKDYVVLNFTEKSGHIPEDKHLIHVVFINNFKEAELWSSSNGRSVIHVKGDVGMFT